VAHGRTSSSAQRSSERNRCQPCRTTSNRCNRESKPHLPPKSSPRESRCRPSRQKRAAGPGPGSPVRCPRQRGADRHLSHVGNPRLVGRPPSRHRHPARLLLLDRRLWPAGWSPYSPEERDFSDMTLCEALAGCRSQPRQVRRWRVPSRTSASISQAPPHTRQVPLTQAFVQF
jgi:hypothetical protein